VRAWDWAKPLLVAPAMNTCMWDSRFTARQLDVLRSLGAHVIAPVRRMHGCGTCGRTSMRCVAGVLSWLRTALRCSSRHAA